MLSKLLPLVLDQLKSPHDRTRKKARAPRHVSQIHIAGALSASLLVTHFVAQDPLDFKHMLQSAGVAAQHEDSAVSAVLCGGAGWSQLSKRCSRFRLLKMAPKRLDN